MINQIKQRSEVNIREPSLEEFLEIAQNSYDNFINETAMSTGESVFELKKKMRGPL